MNPAQTPEKAYLDIKELKARTGLSVATLHRLKRQGKLPHYQPAGPGGRLLFPPAARAWMQPNDILEETSDHAT